MSEIVSTNRKVVGVFFNTNFFVIIATTLVICYLAVINDWKGIDIMQIIILETFVVFLFGAAKYFLDTSKKTITKLIEFLVTTVLLIPLLSLILLLMTMFYELDVRQAALPFFSSLKQSEQWQILYAMPFLYLWHLCVSYAIPSFIIIIHQFWNFVVGYKKDKRYFFAKHNPVSLQGAGLRLQFLTVPFILYAASGLSNTQTAGPTDSFILWFFIISYFMIDLFVHWNSVSKKNRRVH